MPEQKGKDQKPANKSQSQPQTKGQAPAAKKPAQNKPR